ncbi:transglutaminase-like domain-containing protein [Gemmata sp. JC717]|uniref:transglutaminase-like domain-containing protein n=1 Tax=Gemmata algarum TaxID=2975278 RepID=UPI0021BAE9EA|nr:transglutaminase-like domain-containing protein [Gemmata algarum]MDY3556943.1 transglutaminase-like domain-containing protein [Gemmata algarum]
MQGEPAGGGASQPARPLRRATFALVALSALAVEVAAVDTRPVLQSLGLAGAWVAVAAALARLVPVSADARRKPPGWVFLVVLALMGAPVAAEPLVRRWAGGGYPLELQMVCGLRNVGLGLAACAGWVLCLRAACVVSLFLMLFSAAMTNHPAVLVLLGLYAAVGSGWLVLVYWIGLRAAFVTAERAVTVEVEPTRVGLPWVGLCVLVLTVGGGAALAVVGPKRATAALGELVPTSGGTGDTDPFARYGLGDGPEETAGDNAKAAGMVETDKMIEDNKNALIDAVSDMYGPPHKPPKDQERTVAAGLAQVIENHGKLPDNRRPSRDFDTGRKGPNGDKKPGSQGARGLFEVEGRTPLHVRLVVYERYDPAAHRWRGGRQPNSKLLEPDGDCWMRLGHLRAADWYGADERHRLKAADMKDNLVPTPALLARVRINKVDKPDYYEWDYDGVLALAGRRKTPPGVVVATDCRTLDPRRLPDGTFAAGGLPPVLGEVPDALRPEVARVARAWAGDRPRGWPQIEAVLAKLRTEYVHDRGASAPPDHPAPVLWFLLESRRGPDYLFATAATLLLRTLDYPARVCLGYYADPAAYDPETEHTPVRETDLHVWAEVPLRDGHWLVVEPTPGYEVLEPRLPFSQRVLNALAAGAAWVGRNLFAVLAVAAGVAAVAVRRRHLIDAAAVLCWRWFPGPTWRDQVRRAVSVLERRARWAGAPRAPGQTVTAWVRAAAPAGAPDAHLARIAGLTEWAAYAPDGPPPWTADEVAAVCRAALAAWTLRRWHGPLSPTAGDRP